jgi:propionyl-CoA synthetase
MIDADGYVSVMSRDRRHHQCRGPSAFDGRRWKKCWPRIPDVAECAVVGVQRYAEGRRCRSVCVGGEIRRDATPEDALARELVGLVREKIGPVAAFKDANVVDAPAEDAQRQDPARHHAARSPMPNPIPCRRPLMIRRYWMRSRIVLKGAMR